MTSVIFAFCTLVWAGSAFAQTAEVRGPVIASPESQSAAQLAQHFVDERLAVWRQRLKLEGWKISAVMTRKASLAPQTLGGIHWDKHKRTAEIWVLDPADYALPFHEMLDDMELTVVHELVHLELTSLPRGQANRGAAEERAVSGLADAMLALDRRERQSQK
jgi:hypothetical protein